MLDKNGMEIKTGMVVEIKDAFFKNDNGLYFVETPKGFLPLAQAMEEWLKQGVMEEN